MTRRGHLLEECNVNLMPFIVIVQKQVKSNIVRFYFQIFEFIRRKKLGVHSVHEGVDLGDQRKHGTSHGDTTNLEFIESALKFKEAIERKIAERIAVMFVNENQRTERGLSIPQSTDKGHSTTLKEKLTPQFQVKTLRPRCQNNGLILAECTTK
jgi:hypothetical protein